MEFSPAFIDAFKFSMRYEVGPFFDMNDPEVVQGLCATRTQRRKVGYVNIPEDRGGETKFGVAKNANPDLNIRLLTLEQAMEVYYDRYWMPVRAGAFPEIIGINLFDAAVNHGVRQAAKFLQRSVGTEPDGLIGNITIGATLEIEPIVVCERILDARSRLFNALANKYASQRKFLRGWMARVSSLREYIDSI